MANQFLIPSVSSLDCMNETVNVLPNPIIPNTPVTGTVTIPYTGGNGAAYTSQTINSTFNEGLVATLVPGVLSSGTGGNLVFNITGQVLNGGTTAVFNFTFGGQSCQFGIQIPEYFPQGNQWYVLYPCLESPADLEDPSIRVLFSKAEILSAYVNETKYITWGECFNVPPDFSEPCGCYMIKLWTGATPTTNIFPNINELNISSSYDCNDCGISYCISIGGGTGFVKYISYNNFSLNQEVTTPLPALICTRVKPYISISTPIIKVMEGVDCEDGCSISCFKLTNCETGQIIYSNNQSLFTAYASNKTVKLNELDGCWTIETSIECECLEDVSIAFSYSSCETCLPIVAFKLTNCENESLVKYSQEDLSEYDGKVVFLDCGDCWFLERIDYQPPSVQEFFIEFAYDTCVECGRAYFILFDCAGELEPITTYTDLTEDYDANNIIKLAGYPSCWSIQTSPTPDFANAVEVVVSSRYEECAECLAVVGCKCTKVKNTTTETLTYTYKDCKEVERTFTLVSGATSPKFCLNQWVLVHLTTDIITESGDCMEDPNDQTNKICPADPTGRMVKPGYTVPGCDTEKFETITCKTAEVLYKQVLQKRYGISNCCPDEDENLILKKEVIDLQLLNDLDYPCVLPSPCCAPAQCSCSNCKS